MKSCSAIPTFYCGCEGFASTLGTYSLDTYSLLGFTAAHRALDEVCD